MTRRQSAPYWLNPANPTAPFPPVELALREPDGLLAVGGGLEPERLLNAYRHGIFPWYSEGQPILWWSPDPRCVMRPGQVHAGTRLRRYLRASPAALTFNRRFGEVIRACAAPRRDLQGTWITPGIVDAFERLHAEGWAHSIEVTRNSDLIGGIYGLVIGGIFFGESMFSRETNASKFAMLGLSHVLRRREFELIDCQVESAHLKTLGAITLPRRDFADILKSACDPPVPFDNWPGSPISVADLA